MADILDPPPHDPEPEPPGMDDSHFLGSICGMGMGMGMGDTVLAQPAAACALAAQEEGAAAQEQRQRQRQRQRGGCPKVYHPACIKRDDSFFTSRTKWNCGWHICSSCEKAGHYMCYTCTFSACKVCVKHGKFFAVRGAKGFCDTCFGTILLIETKDEGDDTKVRVDFDDRFTWEYLFKLYWSDLKGKLSLTMEELTSAKSRWSAPIAYARKEKDESSDDLYDANYDDGAGKRRRANPSRKRGKKRQNPQSACSVTVEDVKVATGNAEKLPKKEPSDGVSLPLNTKWASPELLEFVGHTRDGDQSFISQFDVQALLLDYIKKNDLRDPRRKSQVICDSRLQRLFKKTHVAHFEMLRLLEMHCPVSDASTVNNGNRGDINLNSAQIDATGYGEVADKLYPDRKKRMHRKMERESLSNLNDYAAIDMHNISLIYLRRSLMEDLIDDPTFSDKVSGGFVRIKITDVGQKQDMYRLVKVVGTHKVAEKYNIGKKKTNFALEILNLKKKEIITMDTISNQDFTQEECKRLRQSMKYGLIDRLKVVLHIILTSDDLTDFKVYEGDIQDKATIFQSVRVNDLLNNSEERARRINEVLEVHIDSHMNPDYESSEEMDDKRAVEQSGSGKRSNGLFSPIKVQNYAKIMSDAIRNPKNLSKQSTIPKLGAGRSSKNSHSTTGTDIPKSGTNVSSKMCEAAPVSSPGVTPSTELEPEKVWHYKDPSGNVQGPFTLLQLSKWTAYFPRDLRVWLIFESEERSLLLTEVLSKQPKDFGQVPSVRSSKTKLAGSGQHRNSSNVDLNSTPSPAGYSRFNSSETTVQSTKYSVPERVSPLHSSDELQHGGVQGRHSAECNNGHNRGDRWSPSTTQTSCSGQNNVESHRNQHASRSQAQHKSSLQAGCVKDLDSRQDYSHTVPTQLTRRDVPSPALALSPSESRTASSQHESSCLSSTNPGLHDELHSSITSEKTKSCAPATSVEDRGSSSPSAMLAHSERVPVCSQQSVPSAAIPEICKVGEEMKNEEKTRETDASNVSVNQSPQSKMFPDSSPDNQDIEREYLNPVQKSESKKADVAHSEKVPVCSPQSVPAASIPEICKAGEIKNEEKTREADASNVSVNQSPQSKMFPDSSPDNQDIEHERSNPTQKSESKKADVAQSGSKSAIPETLDTKIPDHSPASFVSPKFDLPTGEVGATDSVPNLEKTDVSGEDLNSKKECYSETSLAIKEKVIADPAPIAKSIDASDVPESACDVPTGEIRGVDNVEKTVLSGDDSNTRKECYSKKTTLVTREKSVADPACAELINTPDVPESVSNLEKRDSKGQDYSDIQKELYNESILVTSKKLLADSACAESINGAAVLERDLMGAGSNSQKELYSKSTLVTSEKMVVEPASCAESVGVPNILGSASNLERRDLNDEDPIVQKELFSESMLVTGDKMVVKPVSRAESVDVSTVLESVSNMEGRDLNVEDSIVQKELFTESTLVTSDKMVVDPASCADVSDVLESVFNLEKTGLEGEHSNIQKELYEESALVTRENMVTDPASVHVSDVLEPVFDLEKTYLGGEGSDIQKELHEGSTLVTREYMAVDPVPCAESTDVSLTEQNRGTLCMDALAAIEQFMTASPEEEPQCSSPIALSPWGESGYYQGDAVDSGLWGVQDDTINEMWSLLSPTPTPQNLSGVKSEAEGGAHVVNAATVAQGEYDFFQRDPTPGVHWGLTEQVKPKATAASASPIDVNVSTGAFGWQPSASERSNAASVSLIDVNVSTGAFGWQPSADERSNAGAAWSTGYNPNMYSSYGAAAGAAPSVRTSQQAAAAPSVRSSQQAPVKQEYTELDAANFRGALRNFGASFGNNTKSWNAPAGNANRGSQRRDRYSEISESWLLSSNNNPRSRTDGFSGGGTSQTPPRGHR
ncbi:Zinc finger CCCH domain-containing protein 20 [Triticum urartu]|uniref:Zinc finger CCCH domain-containing protein 20 n=1 Tax=Triticum urartu TaxID=4572 RepID=M7YF09_TRIUA|nr:Zinc finger CCCH domain-containing protein 20 [Triticum urartu]